MKKMKRFGLLVGSLVMAAGLQCANAADTTSAPAKVTPEMKVAVVNVQQILQQSPRVANLSKKLEGQFKDRQSKITEDQTSLQTQMEKLKKDSATMSAKDRETAEKKVAADRAKLVKEVMSYQQDLQSEQNKVMQSIIKDLNTIVSDIAKDKSYQLVLDSQAVIFSTETNDLTKDVSKKFNDKG